MMPKFKVKLSKQVKDTLKKVTPEEREFFWEAVEKIQRNPYTGTPMWGGVRTRIWNRIKWLIWEIKLFLIGWIRWLSE